MLNRELDEPVVDLLFLNLDRDSSVREALTDETERDAVSTWSVWVTPVFLGCRVWGVEVSTKTR